MHFHSTKQLFEHMPTEEIHRRVREHDLMSSTFLRSPPPAHDPIFTPLFTAAFTALNFSAGAAALLGGISTGIATTGVSIGVQEIAGP